MTWFFIYERSNGQVNLISTNIMGDGGFRSSLFLRVRPRQDRLVQYLVSAARSKVVNSNLHLEARFYEFQTRVFHHLI